MSFEEFSMLMESRLCLGWRSALGEEESENISGFLFNRLDNDDSWRFDFAVKKHAKWCQVTRTIQPYTWDITDIDDDRPSPENYASTLVGEMLDECAADAAVWA